MNNLKYTHYDVVFQEVPNEVTLVFNISGCPYKCKGCHSKYLWDYIGSNVKENIYMIIEKYIGLITCVCFMGGDQNVIELKELLVLIKSKYNLKTCVYSGSNNSNIFCELMDYIDYLKLGRYLEEFGGLSSLNTNQRFYKVDHVKNNELIDLTTMFSSK